MFITSTFLVDVVYSVMDSHMDWTFKNFCTQKQTVFLSVQNVRKYPTQNPKEDNWCVGSYFLILSYAGFYWWRLNHKADWNMRFILFILMLSAVENLSYFLLLSFTCFIGLNLYIILKEKNDYFKYCVPLSFSFTFFSSYAISSFASHCLQPINYNRIYASSCYVVCCRLLLFI